MLHQSHSSQRHSCQVHWGNQDPPWSQGGRWAEPAAKGIPVLLIKRERCKGVWSLGILIFLVSDTLIFFLHEHMPVTLLPKRHASASSSILLPRDSQHGVASSLPVELVNRIERQWGFFPAKLPKFHSQLWTQTQRQFYCGHKPYMCHSLAPHAQHITGIWDSKNMSWMNKPTYLLKPSSPGFKGSYQACLLPPTPSPRFYSPVALVGIVL